VAMVSLLVVALLLASSLADQVKIENFTFYCKQQDGSHIPLANTHIVIQLVGHNGEAHGDGAEDLGLFDTDNEGRLHIDHPIDFPDGRIVRVHVDLLCSAPYQAKCPGVSNFCATHRPPYEYARHRTATISYTEYNDRKWFLGGVCSRSTVFGTDFARIKDELPHSKMTRVEFCDRLEGWAECDWKQVRQYQKFYKAGSELASGTTGALAQIGNGTGLGPESGATPTAGFVALLSTL
ncbi:hypothetical protein PENTCL1PPCAC_5520, partial [Pristionchus entomophagus]